MSRHRYTDEVRANLTSPKSNCDMSTAQQTEANRRNAKRSTGPRSSEGKAVVSRNALKHGAYSSLPVIPGFERAEDWEAPGAGVLDSLGPRGALEGRLAERVALLLWRLDRVARYETATTAVWLDEADDPPACAPEESSDLFPESEGDDA